METINVLLLSNDKKSNSLIRKNIDDLDININRISSQNLMHTIYKYKGRLLIADLDEYKESVIETINSIQSYDYLPVIYISSSSLSNDILKSINNDTLINKSMLEYKLKDIVKQSLVFKEKYDQTIESYTTIDSINSLTDKVLNKYLKKNYFDYNKFIKNLITKVFANNQFISNKPSVMLFTTKTKTGTITNIYTLSDNEFIKSNQPIHLSSNEKPYYNISLENEVYLNCNTGELSDVENYSMLFNENILEALPLVKNITAYSTSDITIFGLNYENNASSYDADIIKAICVELNLIENINTHIKEVRNSFIYTTNALARAAEVNDDSTGYHIKRVNEFSKLISEHLNLHGDFVKTIHYSAQMHDVGKIHIPKSIICKPGKLTDEEFDMIKNHTIYGSKIIGDSPNLKMAKEIALNHHEKFDGTGYPHGKKGEEIPLSARIVMLADIYDALRSPRPYKRGFTHEEAFKIISKGDGRVMPSHFDPEIHNIFNKIHNKFNEIYNAYNKYD